MMKHYFLFASQRPHTISVFAGGHWGVLETAKPKKKSSKTVKPQKNSAKTENRQKTDTMVTSAAYRAKYTNTLFHQSICECRELV